MLMRNLKAEELIVCLLIEAFAIDDIVFYLVTRSRIGVAKDAKDIRTQKEVLDQQMAALED